LEEQQAKRQAAVRGTGPRRDQDRIGAAMSDVDEKLEALVGRLAATESEYATVAGSRTRKDMRELAKSWIASRLAQVDASIAFVLNGHVGAVESQAVREKLDLEDKRERIIAAAEATTTLTNRQRDSKMRKLAAEMEQLRKQHNEARKQAAMEQLEAEFAEMSGEAA